jgi:hypothetical protein
VAVDNLNGAKVLGCGSPFVCPVSV